MKVRYAAALLLLVVTPALSDAKRTSNNVTFECVVDGSDKDGFNFTAENKSGSEMDCSASCQLTMSDKKKTKEYSYTKTVKILSGRQNVGGEAGLSGKPLTNPDVTKASCTAKK